jgi:type III secretion system FlhB-like substrate exporter
MGEVAKGKEEVAKGMVEVAKEVEVAPLGLRDTAD